MTHLRENVTLPLTFLLYEQNQMIAAHIKQKNTEQMLYICQYHVLAYQYKTANTLVQVFYVFIMYITFNLRHLILTSGGCLLFTQHKKLMMRTNVLFCYKQLPTALLVYYFKKNEVHPKWYLKFQVPTASYTLRKAVRQCFNRSHRKNSDYLFLSKHILNLNNHTT